MKKYLKLAGRVILGLLFWVPMTLFGSLYFLFKLPQVGDMVIEALEGALRRASKKKEKEKAKDK